VCCLLSDISLAKFQKQLKPGYLDIPYISEYNSIYYKGCEKFVRE